MKTLTLSLVIMLTGICLTGCSQNKETKEETVRWVKADTARVYAEKETSTYPGKVRATTEANLSFRISGPIAKIHVAEGKPIRKGQLLAEMDARDYTVQLAATEAEYQQIKAEAERIIELYRKGSVAPNNYDKAVYGLQQIKAKYEAHTNALADTRLIAPFNGYLNKRLREPDETVSAGMPVLSVISSDAGEIEINIPSSDYIRSDRFARYYCTANLYPGKEFPLELIGITPKANLNQLYAMRLRLPGGGTEILAPGVTVMVTIEFMPEHESRRVSIPVSAVFEANNVSTVWVYDSATETVSPRKVKLAQILSNGTAVISDGLNAGEVVLSAGAHSVKEGEKVKLLPPVTATNKGGML